MIDLLFIGVGAAAAVYLMIVARTLERSYDSRESCDHDKETPPRDWSDKC